MGSLTLEIGWRLVSWWEHWSRRGPCRGPTPRPFLDDALFPVPLIGAAFDKISLCGAHFPVLALVHTPYLEHQQRNRVWSGDGGQ